MIFFLIGALINISEVSRNLVNTTAKISMCWDKNLLFAPLPEVH
ncbi:hypothetical protein THF1C08_10060 [Vibrio jasicida]|uniref:Uncharacterized protein n=1 Tax=Vibrio jasicida TaxID=766224 RepID=A0AAU9QEE2_9VIBR|nr:hypothetical protein THF1C08_10060 [Vibrio jasicida]CAH1562362.1 hypothetical protein THF1A12_10059 [Vibrio jasicida]